MYEKEIIVINTEIRYSKIVVLTNKGDVMTNRWEFLNAKYILTSSHLIIITNHGEGEDEGETHKVLALNTISDYKTYNNK